MTGRRTTKAKRQGHGKDLSAARLDAMIEEAIVDAYGESEQRVGFFTMLNDNLAMLSRTGEFGVEVAVDRIDMTEDEQIAAVRSEGKSRQRVATLDLALLSLPPADAEWTEAFRRWARCGR